MAFKIRDLLGRIGPMRPDLRDDDYEYALQEAVRDVARETFIFREVQPTVQALANTAQVTGGGVATTALRSEVRLACCGVTHEDV